MLTDRDRVGDRSSPQPSQGQSYSRGASVLSDGYRDQGSPRHGSASENDRSSSEQEESDMDVDNSDDHSCVPLSLHYLALP